MRGSKWILGAISLVAGVLLCEAVLSWIEPQLYRRPRLWQFDPELGWSHIPSAVGQLVTPEFSVEYRINAAGLRERELAATAPAQQRVLVFGDSFVEGWGVAQDEVVSRQIEARLAGAEVLNFGVAGYGTDQEWLFFEKAGRRYHPDVVAVFFYSNDVWNNAARQGIGVERGYKPFFRVAPDGQLRLAGVPVEKVAFWDEHPALSWRRRAERYLREHWHLYVLLGKAFAPEIPVAQQQEYYEGLYGTGDDPRSRAVWELTGRILEGFAASVQQAGARFLVVYVPAIVQVEEKDWQMKKELHGLVQDYDLRKPNRQLAALTEQAGIAFLDLYEPFKEAAASQTLYLRDSHWNAQGHALAGTVISAYLQQEGWVQNMEGREP